MPGSRTLDVQSLAHKLLARWYADHARQLPWREAGVSGWEVLVSEVMLQRTPVSRVLPVYAAWRRRWPTPTALAADQPGEAVRQWGRMGYPRRALRLHQAATLVDRLHDGEVPSTYDDLRALPGVGDYTAAAVRAFAYRQPAVVLDTNVRRVLGRLVGGNESPSPTVTNAERARAIDLLPHQPEAAAQGSVALMELGALVCTARSPACAKCPVKRLCAWRAANYPAYAGPPRRGQRYAGTDRQCRGRILALLRGQDGPVSVGRVDAVWPDPRPALQPWPSLRVALPPRPAVRRGARTCGCP
ncbi:MAG: A/G-specific adenine glycosylase [Nocardioidaceae bacterium]